MKKLLKVGEVELNNNILLGPMAGFTDKPFRMICEKFNSGLVFTEMISAKALFYKDEKTKKLMNIDGEEHPIAIQIFGSDEESMSYATRYICENSNADIIDINMGCPAPKVVKNGDGSSLLLDLNKAKRIVESVVKNSNKPVSVKIRKGWDRNNIVAMDAAKMIEQAGASMITIHGRTRNEYYSGVADWEIIKKIKDVLKIPVIGNGDVKNCEDAKLMLEQTNCDGVMIARASLGNPWIFRQTIEYLNSGSITPVSKKEKLEVMLEHLKLEINEKGEERAVKEMRKHICYYLKGEKNASMLRNEINHLDSEKEIEKVLRDKLD
ncbi:MAG: tRNA dihydrouridine synthase DusB [Clostridia bacterium]|nr:tRNA dihydrouridine synthase DusB [Clostridia bacterium]